MRVFLELCHLASLCDGKFLRTEGESRRIAADASDTGRFIVTLLFQRRDSMIVQSLIRLQGENNLLQGFDPLLQQLHLLGGGAIIVVDLDRFHRL